MNAASFLRSLLIVATLALGTTTRAALVNITNNGTSLVGDVSKGTLGNNNPSTSFDWLAGQGDFAGKGIIAGYEAITGKDLPVPIFAQYLDAGDSVQVDITGYAYAVLHYGQGSGGQKSKSKDKGAKDQGEQTQGGGIVAYFLESVSGKITFPDKGLGPNGFGGLSSVRLYKGETPRHHVPDGGATWILVATSVAGLAWVSRRRKA